MRFKLAKTYRYWWPVTVQIPDTDHPGRFLEQQLRVEFEPLPQDEAIAIDEAGAALRTMREINDHGVQYMRRVVNDWDGVEGTDGKPVPFTAELLEQALQHAWFRTALQRALRESQNGEAAKLGN